jgi:predicted nucleic acid-binding protein
VSRFVLDNTVTMAWCFTEEATEFTEALLGRLSNLTDNAIVPALWLYEVVNVTELAVRKGRIKEEKALAFLEVLLTCRLRLRIQVGFRYSFRCVRWQRAIG